MGKSHRDNVKARKKAVRRGIPAYKIRAERRTVKEFPCNLCGTKMPQDKLVGGLCSVCRNRG